MISLVQNIPTLVTVTVTERQRTCTNTFLFEFIDAAKKKSYCIATDQLSNNRYNKFVINSLTGSADNTNAEINLNLNGTYTYNIYENPSSSLSPSGLWNCETGILKVIPQPINTTQFTGSVVNPIYQFYGQ